MRVALRSRSALVLLPCTLSPVHLLLVHRARCFCHPVQVSEHGERWVQGPLAYDPRALAAWQSTWTRIGDGAWGWCGRVDWPGKALRLVTEMLCAALMLWMLAYSFLAPTPAWGFRVFFAVAAGLSLLAMPFLIADVRTRVEVARPGLTVVNRWQTHRIRWSDIDVIRVGRSGVELTVGDQLVRCDALTWFPFAIGVRSGNRPGLELTAHWLEETKSWCSSSDTSLI